MTKYNDAWQLTKQWFRITGKQLSRPLLGGGYQGGAIAPESRLVAKVIRADGNIQDLGILSTKVVTTAFVNLVVDQLQSSTGEIANFTWHGMGTGSTAEAIGNTALVTAVESRVSGTQGEGASVNIYRTVATITATSARAIVEHGLFNAATVGTLMDRSVFTVINLSTNDAIQFTYELTVPAGS
tara:strand:- start:5588 stop:6139 length:552 start_codon:yes stop_codon:yes gene_type:complete